MDGNVSLLLSMTKFLPSRDQLHTSGFSRVAKSIMLNSLTGKALPSTSQMNGFRSSFLLAFTLFVVLDDVLDNDVEEAISLFDFVALACCRLVGRDIKSFSYFFTAADKIWKFFNSFSSTFFLECLDRTRLERLPFSPSPSSPSSSSSLACNSRSFNSSNASL